MLRIKNVLIAFFLIFTLTGCETGLDGSGKVPIPDDAIIKVDGVQVDSAEEIPIDFRGEVYISIEELGIVLDPSTFDSDEIVIYNEEGERVTDGSYGRLTINSVEKLIVFTAPDRPHSKESRTVIRFGNSVDKEIKLKSVADFSSVNSGEYSFSNGIIFQDYDFIRVMQPEIEVDANGNLIGCLIEYDECSFEYALHFISSEDYGETWSKTEIAQVSPPPNASISRCSTTSYVDSDDVLHIAVSWMQREGPPDLVNKGYFKVATVADGDLTSPEFGNAVEFYDNNRVSFQKIEYDNKRILHAVYSEGSGDQYLYYQACSEDACSSSPIIFDEATDEKVFGDQQSSDISGDTPEVYLSAMTFPEGIIDYNISLHKIVDNVRVWSTILTDDLVYYYLPSLITYSDCGLALAPGDARSVAVSYIVLDAEAPLGYTSSITHREVDSDGVFSDPYIVSDVADFTAPIRVNIRKDLGNKNYYTWMNKAEEDPAADTVEIRFAMSYFDSDDVFHVSDSVLVRTSDKISSYNVIASPWSVYVDTVGRTYALWQEIGDERTIICPDLSEHTGNDNIIYLGLGTVRRDE